MSLVFYTSAAIAVIATAMAITRTGIVHALLYFIVSLLAVAVVFFVLGAPFIAAVVVIINAGAIMVLFVFALSMFEVTPQTAGQERPWLKPKTWIGPVVLSLILIGELAFCMEFTPHGRPGTSAVDPRQIGLGLFGPYLLAGELASILLLAGILGAFHLGRSDAPVQGDRP
jgi:NADH-quinone oxidoreductase subunit J